MVRYEPTLDLTENRNTAVVVAWLDTQDLRLVRTLRAASVFGVTFWREGVRALADVSVRAEVDGWIDAMLDRGLIARVRPSRYPGHEALTFGDPELARSLEASLPAGERAVAHGLAARWLQEAGELDASVIASHLLKSDAPRDAAQWCAEAARAAVADGDYDAALTWSDAAVAAGVDRTTEAALRMLQTGVHDARGAIEDAERCAHDAWRAAPRGSMEWFRAASSLAVLSMRLLRPEPFRELGPAIEECLRNPATGIAAAGLSLAVFPMLSAGQYALAELVLERLEEILASGEHPEPTFPARVYAARALWALHDDDPMGYLTESHRAAQAYESLSEPRFALLFWNNVGFAQVSLGDGEAATATLNAVIVRASALDLQRIAEAARHNLGLALMLTGKHAEAVAIERHVIAAAEGFHDAQLAAAARIYLSRTLLARGDCTAAVRYADEALGALTATPGARVYGLAIRASALLGVGRYDEALADATDGMRVLDTVGKVEEGEGLIRLAHVEALRATGSLATARAAWERARERLRDRAARIGDVASRERFLGRIPEHAQTLALRWD